MTSFDLDAEGAVLAIVAHDAFPGCLQLRQCHQRLGMWGGWENLKGYGTYLSIFWNLNWWRETFHVSCVSWGASGACTQQSLWRLTLRLLSSMPEQEVEPNVRGLDVLQQLDGSMTKSLSFGVDGRWTKLMFEKLWMLDDVTFVTWLVSFHFSIWTTNDNHEVVTFTAAISACHNVSEWLVGSGRHGDKASWNETRNQKGLGP